MKFLFLPHFGFVSNYSCRGMSAASCVIDRINMLMLFDFLGGFSKVTCKGEPVKKRREAKKKRERNRNGSIHVEDNPPPS